MMSRDAPVSLDDKISIPADVLAQEVAGEVILLHLASEHYYGLDPVGTRTWQLLGQHGNLRAVLGQLCMEYDAPPDRIGRDLLALVQSLSSVGLIVRD